MKSWRFLPTWVIVTVLLCLGEDVHGNTRDVCNRDPPNTSAHRTPGDNGYRVKILGRQADSGYTPRQVYTVTINGTYPKQKLLGFMLVAVPKNAKDETTTMGTFQHFNDGLTKFAEECPHVLTHTYHHPKAGVSVLWTAPPSGSGCVEFRATVVEHNDIWYKDDGALSQVFCEDTGQSESVSPELIPDCCACGVAKYQMTFHGIWSRQSHPKKFPKNEYLLHWSNIVGASHTKHYIPWQYGHYASKGVREVCEYGDPRGVELEMRNHSKAIRTVIKTTGIWVNLKQSRWARFSVNRTHHLMTMLTMLGPSPDWCVGVSALDLCLPNCTWAGDQTIDLLPWDAGTDNGVSYMSPNSKSDPQEKIRRVTNAFPNSPRSPFYGKNPIRPLAKLHLRRIHPKPGMPPSCNGNEQDNDDLDTFAGAGVPVDSSSMSMEMKKKLMMMGKCAMSEWGDWSACSVTCGVGMRVRKRHYLNPEVDEVMCGQRTMEKDNCIGVENECEHPDEDCAVTGWSDWSPCSVTCGKGIRERRRYYLNKMDMKRCHRKLAEIEMCINKIMDCSQALDRKNFTAICILPREEGPCRGNFVRWYYDHSLKKCMPFAYGGCRGNDNRFRELDECVSTCVKRMVTPTTTVSNPGFLRDNSKNPSELITEATEPETKEPAPKKEPIDCMVTLWSEWSECPVTCGRGYQHRRRMIKRPAENGGKKCPKKLHKKKKCKRGKCPKKRKHGAVNCELGVWTAWTPCSKPCGDSIRERSRPVLQQPRNGGKSCEPTIERRYCSLPECPAKSKKRSTYRRYWHGR